MHMPKGPKRPCTLYTQAVGIFWSGREYVCFSLHGVVLGCRTRNALVAYAAHTATIYLSTSFTMTGTGFCQATNHHSLVLVTLASCYRMHTCDVPTVLTGLFSSALATRLDTHWACKSAGLATSAAAFFRHESNLQKQPLKTPMKRTHRMCGSLYSFCRYRTRMCDFGDKCTRKVGGKLCLPKS